MDFESFNQCLTYVQSIKKPSSILEEYQPIVTTLLGIFVGFTINLARDFFKEKRLERKKQASILAEIKSTKKVMEHCLHEAFRLIENIELFGTIPGGSLPSRTDLIITNELFKSIAHTYPAEDIEKISRLLNETSSLTNLIQAFRQETTSTGQGYKLMNIISLSASCHAVSEAFIKKREINLSVSSIANKLEIKTRLAKEFESKESAANTILANSRPNQTNSKSAS